MLKALEEIKKISHREVEGFTNLYFNLFDLLDNKFEKGNYDRYRVLPECTKNVTSEKKDYKDNFIEVLKQIIECLDEYLRERNIWTIFNYHSIFLDKRLNALRTNSMKKPIVKELSSDALSWYGIFGTLNRNRVLKLVKDDFKIISNDIIELSEGDQFVLYIPEGEGFIDSEENKYTDTFCKDFVAALSEKRIVEINGDKKPYLADSDGAKLLKDTDCLQIARTLFARKNMTGWDKECLIYCNKFDTDFADSLQHFPNFLFFKENGALSTEDIALCRHVNWLCVKVSTWMLIFENGLLLDRLEDLVDSKPGRIFKRLTPDPNDTEKKKKMIDSINESSNYIEEVKNVFDGFINDHLKKYHPIIRNDLVIAFYLYWTKFFGTGYLNIKPCFDEKEIGTQYELWATYYETELKRLKIKHGDKYFDFKQFIFDSRGEKYPIEFERTVAEKIINEIHSSKGVIEEFEKIYICNVNDNNMNEEMKSEYKAYIEEKLLEILNSMCVKDSEFKSKLETIIKDGTSPAEYFSIFCHESLVSTGYKYIYYIPSVNYDQSSSGGFSFFCKNKWPRSITKAAQTWATRFGATFSEIEAKKLIAEKIMKHSTKAAMTAIMSRNISHNIGSHVISYWNSELQELLRANESISSKQNYTYSKEEEFIKTSKELFQYIQHRQDFVAELATSIPCSEMSLDLENDIFGPFKSPNEEKYKHKVDSNSEVCISAMLGYIAKSEGINMHKKIDLKTNGLTNTRVSIPNGLVGVHAVYSILENFIRNSAKHYKGTIEDKMIRIDVKEIDQQSYNKSICQDLINRWKEDYLAVILWDWRKGSCKTETIASYKKFLPGWKGCHFSDNNGNLKSGGWGIKEMLTSANFLRKKTPEDLYKYINNPEANENEPPLLEAICDDYTNCATTGQCSCSVHNKTYKGKFGIRFYLRKPKDLAVVLNSDNESSGFEFNENGLVTNSLFAIKRFDKYQDHAKEISSYNMVLVESGTEKELMDDPTCPCRIIGKSDETAGNGTVGDERYLELYEKFIKNTFGHMNNGNLPIPLNEEWYIKILSNKTHFSYDENEANGAFALHLNDPEYVNGYVRRLLNGEYIQPVSGGYSTKAKLTSIERLTGEIQRQVLLEFAEAVFVEVIIVDERISDWANKEFTRFQVEGNDETVFSDLKKDDEQYVVYNRNILEAMKIHVIDVKKENIDYKDLAIKLKDWLKPEDRSQGKKNSCAETNIEPPKPARFFVIHQGVLDKLKDENKDKKLMNNINCRWQVIDSGRGVPEEKKLDRYSNARFVQISALQKLLENYDKHGLAQTLFSTRMPQFKKGNGNGG